MQSDWARVSRAGLLLMLLLGVPGCRRQPGPPRGLLLFVFDAARADHVGAYGYARPTTPAADALAREGLVFRNAFAAAPYTLASFASLFTSKYPIFTNVIREGDGIDPADATLAESFRAAGFATGAFVANVFIGKDHGFARGFETFRNYEEEAARADRSFETDSSRLAGDVDEFLKKSAARRFFLLVHVLLPHNPYTPPEVFRARFLEKGSSSRFSGTTEELEAADAGSLALTPADRRRLVDLYDANLNFGDSVLARVIERLKTAGRLDSTDVVVTSDHGEAFGEHGRYLHNSTVYDEMIRIPLIVRFARGHSRPGKLESVSDNVDLFPTLAELEEVPLPAGPLQGQSLWNSAHDSRKPYVLSYAVELESVAIRSPSFKYIRRQIGDPEYYQVVLDPGERTNLLPQDRERYSKEKTLADYQASLARLSAPSLATSRPLTAEGAARLWALGYLSPRISTMEAELPASGWNVRYGALSVPAEVGRGETLTAVVELVNSGTERWSSFGRFPVRAAYHWFDARGKPAVFEGIRTPLGAALGPGESRQIVVKIAAPAQPGDYRVAIDLVQEFVAWFSARGQPTADARVHVK